MVPAFFFLMSNRAEIFWVCSSERNMLGPRKWLENIEKLRSCGVATMVWWFWSMVVSMCHLTIYVKQWILVARSFQQFSTLCQIFKPLSLKMNFSGHVSDIEKWCRVLQPKKARCESIWGAHDIVHPLLYHPPREGARFCASRAGVARKTCLTILQRSLSDTF